jgi:hypothetical protein
VSLILDALRKLEREKGAHEPGVLVVGSVPWGERSRTRRLLLGAGAVLALALAVLAGWLIRSTPTLPDAARPAAVSPTPVAASVAATPVPATPSPTALAQEEQAPPAPPLRLSHPPVVERPATDPDRAAAAEEQGPEAVTPTPSVAAPAPSAAPAAAPSPTVPDDLRLSAISRRDGKPVALINDRLVFEGDSFDGVRVIRIGEAEVEVEVKGQRRVLRF